MTLLSRGPIDIVVGRYVWQERALARAQPLLVDGISIPVVTPQDLILLKLYAASPQDAWDIQQLLAHANDGNLSARVSEEVGTLPRRSQALWTRLLDETSAEG